MLPRIVSYFLLLVLDYCYGFPINLYTDVSGSGSAAAVALLAALSALVFGCACCFWPKRSVNFITNSQSGADEELHLPARAAATYTRREQNSLEPLEGDNFQEDNNNGPISRGELENIENNNASVYIISERDARHAGGDAAGSRDSVVHFEPLPATLPTSPAALRPGGLGPGGDHSVDLRNLFESTDEAFPRGNLQYLRELGRGWFGRVVEGEAELLNSMVSPRQPESLVRVAVKILNQNMDSDDKHSFLAESKLYKTVNHENVLILYGSNLNEDPWLMIFEFCPMDLKQYVTSAEERTERILLRLQVETAAGLAHLHSLGLVHGDVACRSVMVTEVGPHAKVGDYGVARDRYPEDYWPEGERHGRPIRWTAPELALSPGEGSTAGDVWSLGVLAWEVWAGGARPHAGLSDATLAAALAGPAPPRLPPPHTRCTYRNHLYQVMTLCWQNDPANRPSSLQVYHLFNHLHSSYQEPSSTESKMGETFSNDFENRWENLKPNTIPKIDHHIIIEPDVPSSELCIHSSYNGASDHEIPETVALYVNKDKPPSITSSNLSEKDTLNIQMKSDSLTNLHGSFEDMRGYLSTHEATVYENYSDESDCAEDTILHKNISQMKCPNLENANKIDPWLHEVTINNQDDMSYLKDVSEAIKDLDNILNSEKTSSSESSHQASPSKDIYSLNLSKKSDREFSSSLVKSPGISNFQSIIESVPENSGIVENREMEIEKSIVSQNSNRLNPDPIENKSRSLDVNSKFEENISHSQYNSTSKLDNENNTVSPLRDDALHNTKVNNTNSCNNIENFVLLKPFPTLQDLCKNNTHVKDCFNNNRENNTIKVSESNSSNVSELEITSKSNVNCDIISNHSDTVSPVAQEVIECVDNLILVKDHDESVLKSDLCFGIEQLETSNKNIDEKKYLPFNSVCDAKEIHPSFNEFKYVSCESNKPVFLSSQLEKSSDYKETSNHVIVKKEVKLPFFSEDSNSNFSPVPQNIKNILKNVKTCESPLSTDSWEIDRNTKSSEYLDLQSSISDDDKDNKLESYENNHEKPVDISDIQFNFPSPLCDVSLLDVDSNIGENQHSTDNTQISTSRINELCISNIPSTSKENQDIDQAQLTNDVAFHSPELSSGYTIMKLEQIIVDESISPKTVLNEPESAEGAIIGPFENNTLDLYTGLKTHTIDSSSFLPEILEEEQLAFSSNFSDLNQNDPPSKSSKKRIPEDFSIDKWNTFLGDSFEDREQDHSKYDSVFIIPDICQYKDMVEIKNTNHGESLEKTDSKSAILEETTHDSNLHHISNVLIAENHKKWNKTSTPPNSPGNYEERLKKYHVTLKEGFDHSNSDDIAQRLEKKDEFAIVNSDDVPNNSILVKFSSPTKQTICHSHNVDSSHIKQIELNQFTSKLAMAENENNLNIEYSSPIEDKQTEETNNQSIKFEDNFQDSTNYNSSEVIDETTSSHERKDSLDGDLTWGSIHSESSDSLNNDSYREGVAVDGECFKALRDELELKLPLAQQTSQKALDIFSILEKDLPEPEDFSDEPPSSPARGQMLISYPVALSPIMEETCSENDKIDSSETYPEPADDSTDELSDLVMTHCDNAKSIGSEGNTYVVEECPSQGSHNNADDDKTLENDTSLVNKIGAEALEINMQIEILPSKVLNLETTYEKVDDHWNSSSFADACNISKESKPSLMDAVTPIERVSLKQSDNQSQTSKANSLLDSWCSNDTLFNVEDNFEELALENYDNHIAVLASDTTSSNTQTILDPNHASPYVSQSDASGHDNFSPDSIAGDITYTLKSDSTKSCSQDMLIMEQSNSQYPQIEMIRKSSFIDNTDDLPDPPFEDGAISNQLEPINKSSIPTMTKLDSVDLESINEIKDELSKKIFNKPNNALTPPSNSSDKYSINISPSNNKITASTPETQLDIQSCESKFENDNYALQYFESPGHHCLSNIGDESTNSTENFIDKHFGFLDMDENDKSSITLHHDIVPTSSGEASCSKSDSNFELSVQKKPQDISFQEKIVHKTADFNKTLTSDDINEYLSTESDMFTEFANSASNRFQSSVNSESDSIIDPLNSKQISHNIDRKMSNESSGLMDFMHSAELKPQELYESMTSQPNEILINMPSTINTSESFIKNERLHGNLDIDSQFAEDDSVRCRLDAITSNITLSDDSEKNDQGGISTSYREKMNENIDSNFNKDIFKSNSDTEDVFLINSRETVCDPNSLSFESFKKSILWKPQTESIIGDNSSSSLDYDSFKTSAQFKIQNSTDSFPCTSISDSLPLVCAEIGEKSDDLTKDFSRFCMDVKTKKQDLSAITESILDTSAQINGKCDSNSAKRILSDGPLEVSSDAPQEQLNCGSNLNGENSSKDFPESCSIRLPTINISCIDNDQDDCVDCNEGTSHIKVDPENSAISESQSSSHSSNKEIVSYETFLDSCQDRPQDLTELTDNFIQNERIMNATHSFSYSTNPIIDADDIMTTSFNQESPTDDMDHTLDCVNESKVSSLESEAIGNIANKPPELFSDWESEGDSAQNGSLASGEFIWKNELHGTGRGDELAPIEEEAASSDEGQSSEGEEDEGEGDEPAFVPSSWDCSAAPARSSMKTIDNNTGDKKKVVFKKQKYHCVYEYPRETPDSDDGDVIEPSDVSTLQMEYERYLNHPCNLSFYQLANILNDPTFGSGYNMPDDDFYISSSATPFESLSVMPFGSQFFPGMHTNLKPEMEEHLLADVETQVEPAVPDVSALKISIPSTTIAVLETQKLAKGDSADFTTPDSGVEDITPGSGLEVNVNVAVGEEMQPNVEESSEDTMNAPTTPSESPYWSKQISKSKQFRALQLPSQGTCSSESQTPSSPSPLTSSSSESPLSPHSLGGLRHTRDKLKLDLPPSPLNNVNSPNILSASKQSSRDLKVFDFRHIDFSRSPDRYIEDSEDDLDDGKDTEREIDKSGSAIVRSTDSLEELKSSAIDRKADECKLSAEILPLEATFSNLTKTDDSWSLPNDNIKPMFTTFGKSSVPLEPQTRTSFILTEEPVKSLDSGACEESESATKPEFVSSVPPAGVPADGVAGGVGKTGLEPVRGEGTILDSGDEDSGIESSAKTTLERNVQIAKA